MAAEVSLPVCEVCDPRRGRHMLPVSTRYASAAAAHGLEGVAPVAEVLRPVRHKLQLAGLDLGAVLLALEVAQAGHQLVGGAVEALGLGVEHVDEAPQQALAFVASCVPSGPTPWARMRKASLTASMASSASQTSRVSNSSRSGVAP